MKHPPRKHLVGLIAFLASLACACAADAPAATRRWIPLFNGTNLDGWTVKIAGHPLGVNFADTFRVEDGMIKVAYDKLISFGHIALQAEGQPVWFRHIELMSLEQP